MMNYWSHSENYDTYLFTRLIEIVSPKSNLKSEIVKSPMDWRRLFFIAHQHRVDSILYKSLEAFKDPSAEILDNNVKKTVKILDFQKMAKIEALILISAILRLHDIRFVALKGPLLSQFLHKDPLWRNYGDLDIVVERARFEDVIRLLQINGYEIVKGNKKFHICMLSSDRLVAIEIHFALAPPHFPELHNYTHFWKNLVPMKLQNESIMVLDKETTLVFLCHHGCRHRWERLQWAVDVANLVENVELDWSRVELIAEEIRQERALLIGLFICQLWFDIQVPDTLSQAIHGNDKLIRISKRMIQKGAVNSYWATLTHYRIEVFLIEDFAAQVRYTLQFAKSRLFTLNYKDKPFSAPFFLTWIFYILRFTRLMTAFIFANVKQYRR